MDNDPIIESTKDNIKIIRFNRPNKKNAINIAMYNQVTKLLNEAVINDDISIVVLTGTKDFYSSGHDFVSSKDVPADIARRSLKQFIEAFITFPKMLIAIVNGPAIGIAATTLPFCDFVFASENAYFYTPFTKLGVVAEACSTFTFPKLMGDRKAMEMLILNHKMPAEEAKQCGLISNVYKKDDLEKKSWERIAEISNLSLDSVLTTKKLIRRVNMEELLKTNNYEMEELRRIIEFKSKL